MRKWLFRLLAVGVVAFAGWMGMRAWLAADPVSVRVARVERGVAEASVTNSKAGTVKARRRARLAPEIGGSVAQILAKEGERVARGDVIVRLDDTLQKARLALAERDFESAEALRARACLAAERAGRELERNRELFAQRIVSMDVIDQLQSSHDLAVASCAAAAADVARARAAADVARAERDKTELRAPFDGIVAELSLELGEWITPSPPLLPVPAVVDLIDPGSLYVTAPMDEVDSALLQVGQRAKITLDPYPNRQFPGRVVHVASFVLDVEAQNRTVEIEVEFDDSAFASKLLPGASADVEVVLDAREGVLRVPTSALIEGDKVLVVEGGRLVERAIEVGLKNWEYSEILSGLSEGDSVVDSLDSPDVRAGVEAVVRDGTGSRAR